MKIFFFSAALEKSCSSRHTLQMYAIAPRLGISLRFEDEDGFLIVAVALWTADVSFDKINQTFHIIL